MSGGQHPQALFSCCVLGVRCWQGKDLQNNNSAALAHHSYIYGRLTRNINEVSGFARASVCNLYNSGLFVVFVCDPYHCAKGECSVGGSKLCAVKGFAAGSGLAMCAQTIPGAGSCIFLPHKKLRCGFFCTGSAFTGCFARVRWYGCKHAETKGYEDEMFSRIQHEVSCRAWERKLLFCRGLRRQTHTSTSHVHNALGGLKLIWRGDSSGPYARSTMPWSHARQNLGRGGQRLSVSDISWQAFAIPVKIASRSSCPLPTVQTV